MAKRILSVSFLEDNLQFIEVEKKGSDFLPHPLPAEASRESLRAACNKADEIYINTGFSSTVYTWSLFPKTAKRYLNTLVGQHARDKMYINEPLRIEFKTVDTQMEQWQVAYIGIIEDTFLSVWKEFEGFHKKIKYITSLPFVLASTIARIDQPDKNFIIIWVGVDSTIILISSPQGIVKVARTMPAGLLRADDNLDSEVLNRFSQNITKEISRTLTFFKQEFRTSSPDILYFIGNARLEDILHDAPFPGMNFDIHFNLAEAPVQGMTESQINETLNLTGNLFLSGDFNFVPHVEIFTRKTNLAFKFIFVIIGAMILWAGLEAFQINPIKSERLDKFNERFSYLKQVQAKVKTLREDVNNLKAFEGWKQFYESTYKNQPEWNLILSEIALLVSSEIVIEKFQILPDRGQAWNGYITGKIRAANWQNGLSHLRKFGGKIEASALFKVTDMQYTPNMPEKIAEKSKKFNFQISLTVVPQET
ncbi:putative PilN domain-containing protein [Candidatus Magnetomoraceae bacterium gMMP-15]